MIPEQNDPWALGEIGQKLLEAYERGLWAADDVIGQLRQVYQDIKCWMVDKMGNIRGESEAKII